MIYRNFYLDKEEIDAIIEIFVNGLLEYNEAERKHFLNEINKQFSANFLKQVGNDPIDQLRSDLRVLNNKKHRTSDKEIPLRLWLKVAEHRLKPLQLNVNFNELIEKVTIEDSNNPPVKENSPPRTNFAETEVLITGEKPETAFGKQVRRQAFLFLFFGTLAVVLLIFLKVLFDQSNFGHKTNIMTYEFLQSVSLGSYTTELPVVVLDISDLPLSSNGSVPPDKLREIVEGLFESGAKAVAININFTPRSDSAKPQEPPSLRNDGDFDFFDYLLEQRNKGNPVFLGVSEFNAEPETWLGMPEYQDLAADLTLCETERCENLSEVPMWIKCGEYPKLYSIGAAPANVFKDKPQPPFWLKPLLKDYEAEENLRQIRMTERNGDEISCQKALMPVNYTKLEQMESTAIPALTKEAVLQAYNKFRDKIVIIGKTQLGKTAATNVIIGRNDVVPGVFIPTMAAYTLVSDPIYELKSWFAITANLLTGGLLVSGLFIFRFEKWFKGESNQRWELVFLLIFIALILFSGVLIVRIYNLLWLDFLLVIFAPFLYSKFTNRIFMFLQTGK
ncbi:MAG: CHASE2 domain-containing protein [Pyrinomonadaceae bacterium]|nr:CHASE2 domain-containing protein [Pyrinomonadaceae bacterium]